jgi:hypothetical protein
MEWMTRSQKKQIQLEAYEADMEAAVNMYCPECGHYGMAPKPIEDAELNYVGMRCECPKCNYATEI